MNKCIIVILQSIGIIVINRKETRVVTCRYSSGHYFLIQFKPAFNLNLFYEALLVKMLTAISNYELHTELSS